MALSGQPLVSVCIPTYRGAVHLGAAIGSVLSQSFGDFELIIIDDHSPDDTAAVVAQHKDPRIRYIRNESNLGAQGNWNRCLSESRGKLFKLLPQDELPMEPRELMKEIEKGMPEIIIGKPSFSFDENQGGTGGFSMRLTGESTEQLVELSRTLVTRLRDVPGFDTVRTTARAGEHEVQVIVDRDRAARLGLTPEIVAQTLAAAMRGDRLKEFRAEDREICAVAGNHRDALTLRLSQSRREGRGSLRCALVELPVGNPFPRREVNAGCRIRPEPRVERDRIEMRRQRSRHDRGSNSKSPTARPYSYVT